MKYNDSFVEWGYISCIRNSGNISCINESCLLCLRDVLFVQYMYVK